MARKKGKADFPVEDIFSDFMSDYDEQEATNQLFATMTEASSRQLAAALELTKLIHSRPAGELNAETVLQTFRQVMQELNAISPLQKPLEHVQQAS